LISFIFALALVLSAGLAAAALLAIWLGFRPGDDVALPPPRTLVLNDCEVTYYRSGAGPTLLLIHGLGASSFSWRYLMPLLIRDHEVVALDLPGFGLSGKSTTLSFTLDAQVARIEEFTDKLALMPKAVIGSSLGGLLALELARGNPGRFPRVIALAPAALGELMRWPLARLSKRTGYLRLLVNRFTMPFLVGMVAGNLRLINRGSLKKYLEPYRDPNIFYSFFASFEALADRRLPGLFRDLRVPTLVLWGDRDLQVTWLAIARLQEVLPNAEIKRLNGLPHHPHESHPELIAAEIWTWLNNKTGREP
jgi:pimeloyl-ACP methyl ester carboxylesterase